MAISYQQQYLCITNNWNLNFVTHIHKIIKKATQVRGMLYPVLNRKSLIPLTTRINIMNLYTTSILKYAEAIWAPYHKKTHWKKIELSQTTFLQLSTESRKMFRNEILRISSSTTNIIEAIKIQSKLSSSNLVLLDSRLFGSWVTLQHNQWHR